MASFGSSSQGMPGAALPSSVTACQPAAVRMRRIALVASALAAMVAGYAWGHVASSPTIETEAGLVLLLRFMAVMKLGMALAAVALTFWRVGQPVGPRAVVAYIVASALMLAGPGLIWSMATVAVGAVLFHVGLFGFLVCAFVDREGRASAASRFAVRAFRGLPAPARRA